MNRSRFTLLWLVIVAGPALSQIRTPVPTVQKDVQVLKQQSLSESTKKALKAVPKTRVYPVSAWLAPFGTSASSVPSPFGSAGERFCKTSTSDTFSAVVSIRYEWRPGPRDPATPLSASLIVRKHDSEASRPVTLYSSGVAEAGVDPFRLGFLTLGKADICPSGCVEARLAPRNPADSNLVDQRWQHACWR